MQAVPMELTKPELARIYAHLDCSGECWLWTGSLGTHGYGQLTLRRRTQHAYPLVYRLWRGAVPDGLELDHICRVRACCNPWHLEAVTHRVNDRRGHGVAGRWRQTHCLRGHLYDAANAYIGTRGTRQCRACLRERREG